MSRLSGFFYAYIKPVCFFVPVLDQSFTDRVFGVQASAAFDTAPLLAIFPNRRIADDWWRAVEQSNDYKSSDDTTVTIERATSQLYLASHPGQIRQNLLSRLIEVNQEHGFEVLFLDGEKPSHPLSGLLVIPPDPHRDLISGEWYALILSLSFRSITQYSDPAAISSAQLPTQPSTGTSLVQTSSCPRRNVPHSGSV